MDTSPRQKSRMSATVDSKWGLGTHPVRLRILVLSPKSTCRQHQETRFQGQRVVGLQMRVLSPCRGTTQGYHIQIVTTCSTTIHEPSSLVWAPVCDFW